MAIFTRLQKEPVLSSPCVLTFGTFDGVHLGHKHIFEKQTEEAKRLKLPTALVTFSNHPLDVLSPDTKTSWLTSNAQKLSALKEFGFAAIVDVPFTNALKELTAEEFLLAIGKMLPFSSLVVGPDVSFGKDRKGDKKFLKKREEQFISHFVEKIALDGTEVSSSRIRQLITEGNLSLAERLLGRPYCIEARRASETEWDPQHFALPPKGVYEARVRYNDQPGWHEVKVLLSSIIEIYERNEESHTAEIQPIKFLKESP